MRSAVLSDIHANAVALQAVFDHIDRKGGVDEYWLLGDTVGFGAYPHECLRMLAQRKCVGVLGNNDDVVLEQVKRMGVEVNQVLGLVKTPLNWDDIQFLSQFQQRLELGRFTLVHASPRHPLREAISSQDIARHNFAHFTTPYCLVGHTHVVMGYRKEGETAVAVPPIERGIVLDPEFSIILYANFHNLPR